MDHTNDINTTGMRQIKDEVVLESLDRHASQSRQLRNAGIIGPADPWLFDEERARLIHGGKVSLGQLNALRLAELDELLQ